MTCGRAAGVNCAEILERLYEFVDLELDDDYWHKLQSHLEECSPCLRRVDLERLVKSLVARACCEHAPMELRQRVLFSIRQWSAFDDSTSTGSSSEAARGPFDLGSGLGQAHLPPFGAGGGPFS
jgi:mycothiol system anti-sigma-R factor